jgi:threonine/homoserine/homoserine lactone efflux protein
MRRMQSAGEVLGLALAVAASPLAIIPGVLILLGSRPRAAAGGYLLGWAGGILAVTALAATLAEVIDVSQPPEWTSWVRILLGAGLLVLAVRSWATRSASQEPPAWMASLTEATPAEAVRLGLTLSAANPKVALLAVAAGIAVGSAGYPIGGVVALLALFTAVASLSVALPLLAHVALGPRAEAPLRRAGEWLERNQAGVLAAVLGMIGLALLLQGLAGA